MCACLIWQRILQKNRTSTCSGSSELYTIDDEGFGEGFINKGDITQEDVTQEDAQPEDEEGSNEVKTGNLSDGKGLENKEEYVQHSENEMAAAHTLLDLNNEEEDRMAAANTLLDLSRG